MSNSAVQCPKCSKFSVVETKPGVYRCIACDFSRNLNPKQPKKPKPKTRQGWQVWMLAVGIAIAFLIAR